MTSRSPSSRHHRHPARLVAQLHVATGEARADPQGAAAGGASSCCPAAASTPSACAEVAARPGSAPPPSTGTSTTWTSWASVLVDESFGALRDDAARRPQPTHALRRRHPGVDQGPGRARRPPRGPPALHRPRALRRRGAAAPGHRRELQLFADELALDLARFPVVGDWPADDRTMLADLITETMVSLVATLVDSRPEDREAAVDRAERQLRLISVGATALAAALRAGAGLGGGPSRAPAASRWRQAVGFRRRGAPRGASGRRGRRPRSSLAALLSHRASRRSPQAVAPPTPVRHPEGHHGPATHFSAISRAIVPKRRCARRVSMQRMHISRLAGVWPRRQQQRPQPPAHADREHDEHEVEGLGLRPASRARHRPREGAAARGSGSRPRSWPRARTGGGTSHRLGTKSGGASRAGRPWSASTGHRPKGGW